MKIFVPEWNDSDVLNNNLFEFRSLDAKKTLSFVVFLMDTDRGDIFCRKLLEN